jgi:hypothetical protein
MEKRGGLFGRDPFPGKNGGSFRGMGFARHKASKREIYLDKHEIGP